jgi:hypothetical protein
MSPAPVILIGALAHPLALTRGQAIRLGSLHRQYARLETLIDSCAGHDYPASAASDCRAPRRRFFLSRCALHYQPKFSMRKLAGSGAIVLGREAINVSHCSGNPIRPFA